MSKRNTITITKYDNDNDNFIHAPFKLPDGSFGPVVARKSKVLGLNPGHRGCAYTVLQTVEMPRVCSDVYVLCTMKNLEVIR